MRCNFSLFVTRLAVRNVRRNIKKTVGGKRNRSISFSVRPKALPYSTQQQAWEMVNTAPPNAYHFSRVLVSKRIHFNENGFFIRTQYISNIKKIHAQCNAIVKAYVNNLRDWHFHPMSTFLQYFSSCKNTLSKTLKRITLKMFKLSNASKSPLYILLRTWRPATFASSCSYLRAIYTYIQASTVANNEMSVNTLYSVSNIVGANTKYFLLLREGERERKAKKAFVCVWQGEKQTTTTMRSLLVFTEKDQNSYNNTSSSYWTLSLFPSHSPPKLNQSEKHVEELKYNNRDKNEEEDQQNNE